VCGSHPAHISDEAIRLYPNYALAWNGKGDALKSLGRTEEAEVAFTKTKRPVI
jgi:Flp pilus assembly protein TadD